MKKITVIKGSPGSGKTTKFISRLSKDFPYRKIWVLEPVQTIVEEKRRELVLVEEGELVNVNMEFINYSEGFTDEFYRKNPKDIIVIDEVQNLFFSEFRNLDIRNLEDVFALWEDIYVISATPEILEIYLQNREIPYEVIDYGKRLRRDKIRVNIIPTKLSSFLSKENILNFDIVSSNSIKNLSKIERELLVGFSDYSLVVSKSRESNYLLFGERIIKDNRWFGTVSLGQGLDKFSTITTGVGRVVFDGNTYKNIPDFIKYKFRDRRFSKGIDYKRVLYLSMIENLIQLDRFRVDLDVLHIDFILHIDEEYIPLLSDMIRGYLKNVYGEVEVQITVDNNIYNGKLGRFSPENFEEYLNNYDVEHTGNKKTHRERFLELVDDWCNPMDGDDRRKPIGNYKNTLKYFSLIFNKFIECGDVDSLFFDNDTELARRTPIFLEGLGKFIERLISIDFKKYGEVYYNNKNWTSEEKEKKKIKGEDDVVDLLKTQFDYFGESLLQILLGHFGVSYNTATELSGRGTNPLSLLSRPFRKMLIVNDIDIKGSHIVALVKNVLGDTTPVSGEDIETLYSYKTVGRDRVLSYMKRFSKGGKIPITDIENYYGGERKVCKNAILWAINKGEKYRKEEDLGYISEVMGSVYPIFLDLDLSKYKLGYRNGVEYESKWLGYYKNYRGVIYRMADGLCQIYGYPEILTGIRDSISSEWNIPISIEDISKYDDLGVGFKLDDFLKENDGGIPLKDSVNNTIQILERFRKYLRKGKYQGKSIGKSIGKSVGKSIGKSVGKSIGKNRVLKNYEVMDNFYIKKTGLRYKKGLYKWYSIPKEIPISYRNRYIRKI